MTFFESADAGARAALEGILRPVRFGAGQCLLREGDPGDGCYLIDSGEVRVELRCGETDTEHVLCHLGAGALLGEFSLVDGQPRSASAYAQTETAARWLGKAEFDAFCREQPQTGLAFLSGLSRDMATKLRQENRQVAEYLFAGEPDQETQEMTAAAVAAQKELATWSETRVDALLEDIGGAVAARAEALATANVADTGIGNVPDKVLKIRFAGQDVYRALAGQTAVGALLRADAVPGVCEIAAPVGVVLGIIPVTNPVSTIVFKTLICLKSRNALIFSCHRDALRVGDMVGQVIREALARHGAPVGLVQWIRKRADRRKTMVLMKHPAVALILATGGPSIVQAAYSSGKPAIGVGAGNAPVLVCGDADIPATAGLVIRGKAFDNGVICGSENNLVVVQAVAAEFRAELTRQGAAVLSPDETHRLSAGVFEPDGGGLRREFVGKSAAEIAKAASLRRESPPRLLVVPVNARDVAGPFGHEKLAPILSLFTVADVDQGMALCRTLLEQQGMGHTAIVHTRSEEMARRFGLEMPASRILVNVAGSLGCIGAGTGLTPSFTLGCGTGGGTSTTDNVTYSHLRNLKRLAFPSPPAPGA